MFASRRALNDSPAVGTGSAHGSHDYNICSGVFPPHDKSSLEGSVRDGLSLENANFAHAYFSVVSPLLEAVKAEIGRFADHAPYSSGFQSVVYDIMISKRASFFVFPDPILAESSDDVVGFLGGAPPDHNPLPPADLPVALGPIAKLLAFND